MSNIEKVLLNFNKTKRKYTNISLYVEYKELAISDFYFLRYKWLNLNFVRHHNRFISYRSSSFSTALGVSSEYIQLSLPQIHSIIIEIEDFLQCQINEYFFDQEINILKG